MVYVLYGNPIALSRPRFHNSLMIDSQKIKRLVLHVELERLHDERPFMTGILQLIATFYFPLTHAKANNENKFHAVKPSLVSLCEILCNACIGVIIADDCTIANITMTKRYSMKPRTEFYFMELK